MMRLVSHSDLDKVKYDRCVSASSNPKLYGLSHYLDAVHPSWDALVWGDFEAVCPLTTTTRWWRTKYIQPVFTQQLGVFSQGESLYDFSNEAMEYIQKHFRHGLLQWHDQSTEINPIKGTKRLRKNYILPLDKELAWSKNHQRAIKKGDKAGLSVDSMEMEEFDSFFAKHNPKYKEDILPNQTNFQALLNGLKQQDHLKILAAKLNDAAVAAIAWGLYNRTLYYLFPAISPEGRNIGANTWLIQQSIQSNPELLQVDFEGSEVPGVEKFILGFDANLAPYPLITW